MRALVIGRGSMGKRRIRDLTALGVEVESWDITDGPMTDEQAAGKKVAVICTPPGTKFEYVQWALVTNSFEAQFTEADVETFPHPHHPSCTPLFTDWFARLERDIDVHASTSYVLHVGQHIDDWHPGADRATYYAYQDATGPTREMVPFELIWLTKLFGPVRSSSGQRSPELATLRVEHDYCVGRIIIDAVSRPPIRTFEIFGSCNHQYTLTYSEETYLREMRAFVQSVKGEAPWPYSLAEERANLEVLHTIERAG